MKPRLVWLPLFVATVLVARAQLVLNPGDVWTYSFGTMTFGGTVARFSPNYGYLGIMFSDFPGGVTLKYEMFEGAPAGGPFRSGLITSGANFSTAPQDTWQDLNGSVRLTMLTGACTVASVTFSAALSNPQNPLNSIDTYYANASLTSPPPRLAIQRLSNAVEVSWWTNGTAGYVLESINVLRTGAWPEAAVTTSIVSDRNVVTVSPTGQVYFRLRK